MRDSFNIFPLPKPGGSPKSVPGKEARLIPLFLNSVQAGLPAEAHDAIDRLVNLNDYLTEGRPDDFEICEVTDDAMKDSDLRKGYTALIDKKAAPKNGKIVFVVLKDELLIRRLTINGDKMFLAADDTGWPPVDITHRADYLIVGVVTRAFHSIK